MLTQISRVTRDRAAAGLISNSATILVSAQVQSFGAKYWSSMHFIKPGIPKILGIYLVQDHDSLMTWSWELTKLSLD